MKCLPYVILLSIILTVAFLHLLFMHYAPETKIFGDEKHYLSVINQEVQRGNTSLLPGKLRFAHRPRLITRVYAQFIERGDSRSSVLKRTSKLNLLLFLFLLIFVYCQARLLQIGQIGSLTACALLGFFPWFGFYVHALWPEIVHAGVLGLAFTLVIIYLVKGYWILLFPAGICFGYAMLLKGTINGFIPMVVVYLIGATLFMFRQRSRSKRIFHTTAGGIAIIVGVLIVILPQMIVNARAGHGYRLAANRWRNIEWGIRMPVKSDTPQLREFNWAAATNEYFLPGSLVQRENLSRDRTLEFISSMPLTMLVNRQLEKASWLIFNYKSHFEQSVGKQERWGNPPPLWISVLENPARCMWYILLVFALIGFLLFGGRNPGWGFLSLFTIYYILALLVIPATLRFAIQLVPTLCIFAAAAVSWVVDLIRRSIVSRTVYHATNTTTSG